MPTAVDDLWLLMAVVPDATPDEQAAFLDLPESACIVTMGLVARCAKAYIEEEAAYREKVTKALSHLFTAVIAEQELRDLIARHFRDDADLAARLDAHARATFRTLTHRSGFYASRGRRSAVRLFVSEAVSEAEPRSNYGP